MPANYFASTKLLMNKVCMIFVENSFSRSTVRILAVTVESFVYESSNRSVCPELINRLELSTWSLICFTWCDVFGAYPFTLTEDVRLIFHSATLWGRLTATQNHCLEEL